MKLKKLLGILLALVMVVCLTTVAFAAEGDTTIGTVAELQAFAAEVNNGNTFEGKTVTLTASLDLTGVTWTPIGNGTRSGSSYSGSAFKGTFDGGNYTISGLTIANTNAGDAALGLFGVVNGGTVKNLNLVVAISGNGDNVGAAVGLAVGGATIDTVAVSGSVAGADGVGGVVGRMTISGTISNCVNNAAVTATGSGCAGGIVGKAYYTAAGQEMNITECTNSGAITSDYAAGGIVGFSAANVTKCTNSGKVTANTEAGGIVGEQTNYGEISGNTNSGAVSNNTSGGTAYGGIIGWIRYQNSSSSYGNNEVITVSGNTNTGTISASDCSLGAGGIVGTIYNQASVTGNTNEAASITGGTFAAGIVGGAQISADNLSITNATITTSNNVSTTSLNSITGDCVASDVYNNDNTFESSDNSTEWVAQIGTTKYATLAGAFTAAVDGDTITLLADVTADSTVKINKSITLDGDNHKISGTASPLLNLGSTANITVQNATLTSTGNVVRYNYVKEGYTHTYQNCLISGGVYGIHYDGSKGGAVVIDGCTIDGFNAFAGALAQVTVKNTTFDADQSGYAGANFWGNTVIENVTLVDEGKTTWLDVKTVAEVIGGKVVKGDTEISLESYLDAAAKIGDVYYNTLQDAVDAAASGDTVTLLADTTGAGVVFDSGDNVIIDLNGKTYTLSESVGSSAQHSTVGFYLWSGSTVTIKNGTINMVEDQMGDAYTFFKMFHTYGDLTITDVTLDCANGVAYNGSTDTGFIAVESDNGTVVLNGNTSIINCSDLSAETWTVTAYNKGQINIDTTGTIDGVVVAYGSNAAVEIKNGTFTDSNTAYDQLYSINSGTVSVYNGTFSEDPSAYCVTGYTGYQNADGTWGVVKGEKSTNQTVTITVTPADAEIVISKDGEVIGTAAGTYNLPSGTYTYTVSKAGYYTEEDTFKVAGETQNVTVSLAKLPTLYTITRAQCENGEVSAQAMMAAKGSTIKVSAEPAEGYKVASLTVTDAAGNEIEVVDGKFTMPASNVTVSATFVYDLPFTDVADDNEHYAAIAYMYVNGLMIGTSEDEYVFSGEMTMTRAQIAQILYRLAGEPAAEYAGTFTDAPEGAWYTEAVEWAAAEGIVNGVGNDKFAPNREITVTELAALVYRYAQCQLTGECQAADWETESVAAMTWCIENGILAEGTTVANRYLAAGMFYNVYNLLNK